MVHSSVSMSLSSSHSSAGSTTPFGHRMTSPVVASLVAVVVSVVPVDTVTSVVVVDVVVVNVVVVGSTEALVVVVDGSRVVVGTVVVVCRSVVLAVPVLASAESSWRSSLLHAAKDVSARVKAMR
jgi:hypothetical protein